MGRLWADVYDHKVRGSTSKKVMGTCFTWLVPGRVWTPSPHSVSSEQEARDHALAWYNKAFPAAADDELNTTVAVPALDAQETEEKEEDEADKENDEPTQMNKSIYVDGYTCTGCSWAPGGTAGSDGQMARRMSTHGGKNSGQYGYDQDHRGKRIPLCPNTSSFEKTTHKTRLPESLPHARKHWSVERAWRPLRHGDLVEVRAEHLAKPGIIKQLGAASTTNARVALVHTPSSLSYAPPTVAPAVSRVDAAFATLLAAVHQQARAVAASQPICEDFVQLMMSDNAFRPMRANDTARLGLFLHIPLTEVSLQNNSGQEALTLTQLHLALSSLTPNRSVDEEDGVFITVLNPIEPTTGEMDSTLPLYDSLCKTSMQLALATGAKALVAFGAPARQRWQWLASEVPGVASAVTNFSAADQVTSTWLKMEDGSVVRVVHAPHPCLVHKLLDVILAIRAARIHIGENHAPLAEDELTRLASDTRRFFSDLASVTLEPTVTSCTGWEVDGDNRYVLGNGILTHNCAMIAEAHIGVGIAGVEGTAATNTADYAVGSFRMLHTLLFVHGYWSYQRQSKLVNFIFYKASLVALAMYI